MDRRTRIYILTMFVALSAGHARAADAPRHESIEWSDIWVADADKDVLPRVLLVGDSIARGYYDPVQKALAGKAYVARCTTSKFMGQTEYISELSALLSTYRFDVIVINNGLHGWAYNEDEYANSFPKLFDTLRGHAKDAKILWAVTTPVRVPHQLDQIDPKTGRVKERNRIATEIMRAHKVPIIDLFALVEAHPDLYADDGTHFNEKGRTLQGKQVAEAISAQLANLGAKKR